MIWCRDLKSDSAIGAVDWLSLLLQRCETKIALARTCRLNSSGKGWQKLLSGGIWQRLQPASERSLARRSRRTSNSSLITYMRPKRRAHTTSLTTRLATWNERYRKNVTLPWTTLKVEVEFAVWGLFKWSLATSIDFFLIVDGLAAVADETAIQQEHTSIQKDSVLEWADQLFQATKNAVWQQSAQMWRIQSEEYRILNGSSKILHSKFQKKVVCMN